MQRTDTIPWYRQPLVWMIIAIPLSAVIVGSFFIYLSIVTDDGLVADDYYKQGMAINKVIARDQLATELGLAAGIEIDDKTGYIKVDFRPGRMQEVPLQLALVLRHATQQQQDNHVVLDRGIDNQFIGATKQDIHKGVWYVELSNRLDPEKDEALQEGQRRMSTRVRIDGYTRLELDPAPAS